MKSKSIDDQSKDLLNRLHSLSTTELERLVRIHNLLYFVENSPEISDEVFDKLVTALRVADPSSPALREVGSSIDLAPAEFGNVVIHQQKMLSLDKCYSDETFDKWREKIVGEIIAMPKIDGVACSLCYNRQGKLVSGATRGDGSQGENITKNVLAIADVPSQLNAEIVSKFPSDLEVRGEVYMRISRFKELYADTFVNPRNLAAGALKQKDAGRSGEYGLSFFPYDIRGSNLASEVEKFALLTKLGFIVPDVLVLKETPVQTVYQQFMQARDSLDYEIDGVVFRANLISEQKRLGDTAHHPRFAIAYKFQGESAQTMVRDIEWSVGRSGIITPVCIVDPVFVSGATVTRASLHNIGIFKSHNILKTTLVEIVRRGGVIPYVERVLRAEGTRFAVPERCPSCDGPVTQVDDFLFCAQPQNCPKVILARILHFVSVVDMQGFGEKIVEQLINRRLVKSPVDLFRLRKDDLLSLERLGEKSAIKLIRERDAKKSMNLARFITAIGFDEVGPTVANNLAAHFSSVEKIANATLSELAALEGIGPAIAHSISQGFLKYGEEIASLQKYIELVAEVPRSFDVHHPLFEKSVVFTGAMKLVERKEAQHLVKEVGGKTPASVSASTDFLVVGGSQDDKSSSSKIRTVTQLNERGAQVKIISEAEFMTLLDNKSN